MTGASGSTRAMCRCGSHVTYWFSIVRSPYKIGIPNFLSWFSSSSQISIPDRLCTASSETCLHTVRLTFSHRYGFPQPHAQPHDPCGL